MAAGRPFAYGGVLGFFGQAMTVLPGQTACLRCLFEAPPAESEIASCREAGILGPVAGIIGALQADEASLFVRGARPRLCGAILTYDARAGRTRVTAISPRQGCGCGAYVQPRRAPEDSSPTPEFGSHNRRKIMSYFTALKCRECGQDYPVEPLHVCETCFGPLEVVYDYARIRGALTHKVIESRARNLWRYRELLPVDKEPDVGPSSGFTPLLHAKRLGAELGLKRLYIKDDTVNHPTLSYKDRVVSVAITKAIEFGFNTVSCASTGNLATAVASHAARAGLRCFIFMPEGVESGKIVGSAIYGAKVITIRGNYDDVNRVCSEIADKYGWAFVNINLRPYYTEGAKTFGYEIAEQLGWKLPQNVVIPTAGGTILPKVAKAFKELKEIGLVKGGPSPRFIPPRRPAPRR